MKVRSALLSLAILAAGIAAASGQQFEGNNACRKCHLDQAESWAKTPHAKAFESLKPKVKAAEKLKAKLDPERDYTKEADCLTCHTTGYGKPGGYVPTMAASDARHFINVGCESCHGAGGQYRQEHGAAEQQLKTKGESTPREVLVKAHQNFDYETACATCHLNFEGSSWKAAKPPFNPFTPKLDPKYAFDALRQIVRTGPGAGVHDHYKLKGAFKGEPVPAVRAETQKDAKEPE